MECLKSIRRHVTSLEIVMFLFMFALFMVVITSQELYLVKACRVNFNHSDIICQNLTRANQTKMEMEVEAWILQIQELPVVNGDRIQEVTQANATAIEMWASQIKDIVLTDDVNKTGMTNFKDGILNVTTENYRRIQLDIQKWVAEIQGYNGLLQSWPAIIFTFFAGPLSEDYGRKPLMVIGLLGYIVLNISFFINTWFMNELGAEYLLFECLQDLFGGDIVFGLGIYALLVDLTPAEDRTRRMSIMQAFMFVGMTFGFSLGKPIQTYLGWSGLYLTSMGLILINMLFIIFVVKEAKREKPEKKEESGNKCCQLLTKCFKTFHDLFRDRPNGMRTWLITFFIMLILEKFFQAGTYPLYVMFFRIQYGVGTEILGMVFGIFTITTLITQLLIIPIMSKKLRDTSLIIIALITSIGGYLIFALGKTVPVLIISYICFGFYASIHACSKSIISKMVGPREIGAVFATIGISSSIASLLSKPFFAFMYQATVEVFPGAYLMVVVAGLTLVIAPITFAHFGLKRLEKIEEESKGKQMTTPHEKSKMLEEMGGAESMS